MIHAIIRSLRNQSPPALLPSNLLLKASGIRFRQATTASSVPGSKQNMDEAQNADKKSGDVMSHSFGDGYATRADEEGFGGVFSGNQSLPKVDQDKLIHENHPAYDKTQGSEVKEKEKGRHQTQSNASTS